MNGQSYRELFLDKIMPEMKEIFPPDILQDFIYQLDGAPGHTSTEVVQILNEFFPNRWFGNKGPLHWAPRSPDLTPLGCFFKLFSIDFNFLVLDFSYWGILRDNVYHLKPKNLIELKSIIKEEVAKFTIDYYQKVCLETVWYRIEECRKNSGQLIEPFIA